MKSTSFYFAFTITFRVTWDLYSSNTIKCLFVRLRTSYFLQDCYRFVNLFYEKSWKSIDPFIYIAHNAPSSHLDTYSILFPLLLKMYKICKYSLVALIVVNNVNQPFSLEITN